MVEKLYQWYLEQGERVYPSRRHIFAAANEALDDPGTPEIAILHKRLVTRGDVMMKNKPGGGSFVRCYDRMYEVKKNA